MPQKEIGAEDKKRIKKMVQEIIDRLYENLFRALSEFTENHKSSERKVDELVKFLAQNPKLNTEKEEYPEDLVRMMEDEEWIEIRKRNIFILTGEFYRRKDERRKDQTGP